MPLYTCLHNLLNVLLEIANKKGLKDVRQKTPFTILPLLPSNGHRIAACLDVVA
jgi:hypothetical protein